MTDAAGFIIASTALLAGNHNDTYHLKPHLQNAFKLLKHLDLNISGAFFSADRAFDAKVARKTRFSYGLIPNIDETKRNQKTAKRGRKRFFNKAVYKRCFTSEYSFAWIDKFSALILRFDWCDIYSLAHILLLLLRSICATCFRIGFNEFIRAGACMGWMTETCHPTHLTNRNVKKVSASIFRRKSQPAHTGLGNRGPSG